MLNRHGFGTEGAAVGGYMIDFLSKRNTDGGAAALVVDSRIYELIKLVKKREALKVIFYFIVFLKSVPDFFRVFPW